MKTKEEGGKTHIRGFYFNSYFLFRPVGDEGTYFAGLQFSPKGTVLRSQFYFTFLSSPYGAA